MTNPAGDLVDGNVTEIDMENRYLLLEDRAGKPFIKIFWKKTQEIFDDKPTKVFTQLQKIKPGWYVAPIVENEESSVGGGLKEANLKELPYKERPADFPRPQKKGGQQGNWQPRKPRITISATVNLQNYENVKVEVEGGSADECTKILIDTLSGFAKNPAYSSTRDMIKSYMARVLNVGGA